MTDKHLDRYADVLIWGLKTARSKPFKPYDIIVINYENAALPLAEILYRKLVSERMHVVLQNLQNETMQKDFYTLSDKKQRTFIRPGQEEFYTKLNGSIFLSAPDSLTHLKKVNPDYISDVARTRKKLRNILEKREEQGLFGWTLCTMPTEALAGQAGLSFKEYTAQIIKACFLDAKDPVKKWEEIFHRSLEIKERINSLPVQKFRVVNNSMDLIITPGEKRKFIGISGHNIPSFELFTSPDWRGTEGTYYSDQPSFRNGNIVRGIQLSFSRGRVVKAAAKEGEAYLKKMLAMDTGASRVGEFSLTDRRFSNIDKFMADTLFDENFGGKYGNCHIALGNSYTDTFKGNPAKLDAAQKKDLGFNESALHWDMVNTEDKEVIAILKNGREQRIYRKGEFQLES